MQYCWTPGKKDALCGDCDCEPYSNANVLHEKPGMFQSWQQVWGVLRGWIAFAALCWAAIYMLIHW